MGPQREFRAGLGESVRQAHVGNVGGLPVGQRSFRRFGVRSLHQTDVHTRSHEAVQVAGRTMEVRLQGGPEAVRQPALGHGDDAPEHRIGAIVVFGPDLDAPAQRQSASDSGEMFRAAPRLSVEPEVGEID